MRKVLGIVCALGLAACAAPPGAGSAAAAPAPLTGSRWVGVVEGNPEPNTLPRLEFSTGGRLAGFTGCNMMSGSWTEEGGVARFGPIMSTKRGCLGPAGEIEKRVLAAMGQGATARRSGERLVVSTPGGARFEFMPAAAS